MNSNGVLQERTEQEIAEEQINVAMMDLPDSLTAAYREACRWAPQLVTDESNPLWFYQFHEGDSVAAARRLCNYWKQRKETFEDRVFRPMNLSEEGALTAEDHKLFRSGFWVNLPRDKRNRTVLYGDASKRLPDANPSARTCFFPLHCVMENETSRNDGFFMLFNISNPFAANFKAPNLGLCKFIVEECLPIKRYEVHMIYIPPMGTNIDKTFVDTIYAWAKDRLGCLFSNLVTHVASSPEDCLHKLEAYGLSKEILPVNFGGTYSGGCEPWRRVHYDGDKVDLEIEVELSCLLRNVMWSQNQKEAARTANNNNQQPSTMNHHQHETRDGQQHHVPLDKKATASRGRSKSVEHSRSNVHHSSVERSTSRRGRSISTERPRGRSKSTERGGPKPPETAEERESRLRKDAIYAKYKRQKKKNEFTLLNKDYHELRITNEELRGESDRLEALLRRAKQELERNGHGR